jgi:hypothetical protein
VTFLLFWKAFDEIEAIRNQVLSNNYEFRGAYDLQW